MPVNDADRYAFSRRRSSVRSFQTEFVYYVRFDEYYTFTEAPAVGGKPLVRPHSLSFSLLSLPHYLVW